MVCIKVKFSIEAVNWNNLIAVAEESNLDISIVLNDAINDYLKNTEVINQ